MELIDQEKLVQCKIPEFLKVKDLVEEFEIINDKDIGTVTDKRVRLKIGKNYEDIQLKEIKSIMFKHEKYKGILKHAVGFVIIFACCFITTFLLYTVEEQILLSTIPVLFILILLVKYNGYYVLQVRIKNGELLKIKIKRSNRDEGMAFFNALKESYKKQLVIQHGQVQHKKIVGIEKQFLN